MSQDKSLCILPFRHLATHPGGEVTLCCVVNYPANAGFAVDHSGQLLNLNRNSIQEVFNSASFQKDRSMMLKGEMPLACQGCYQQEKMGGESKRIRENRKFADELAQIRSAGISDIGDPRFSFIELRLGNLCNLKCRTCNPASSKSWVNDYAKLKSVVPDISDFSDVDSSWCDKPEFWDDLLSKSQDLKLIYINGGEPLLIDQHWVFLEKLVSKGLSKNLTLWYSTNLTIIKDNQFEIWANFKKVEISASMDCLDQRNEYLRYPAKWKKVIAGLDAYSDAAKAGKISLSVTQTVSNMNVFYLDEFFDFMSKRGVNVYHNYVYSPSYYAVGCLPLPLKHAILAKLEKSNLPTSSLAELRGRLLTQQADSHADRDWSLFWSVTNALDQIRGQSFVDQFPEYAALVRQCGALE